MTKWIIEWMYEGNFFSSIAVGTSDLQETIRMIIDQGVQEFGASIDHT